MAEYPRFIEGGKVIEVFPNVFYTDTPFDADSPDADIYDGTRLHYDDFRRTAADLGYKAISASRAFNEIYLDLRHIARDSGIFTDEWHAHPQSSAWDYVEPWGAMNNTKRQRILIATQVVYTAHQAINAAQIIPRKLPQQYAILEALFERESDDFELPSFDPSLD